MAAIITSTSTQFTLDHQNWWPHEHEHDGNHGDKHGHHGDRHSGHKHKHGSGHSGQHEVSNYNQVIVRIYLKIQRKEMLDREIMVFFLFL